MVSGLGIGILYGLGILSILNSVIFLNVLFLKYKWKLTTTVSLESTQVFELRLGQIHIRFQSGLYFNNTFTLRLTGVI